MMRRIVALCVGGHLRDIDVLEPSYNDLLQVALSERRVQRSSNGTPAKVAESA